MWRQFYKSKKNIFSLISSIPKTLSHVFVSILKLLIHSSKGRTEDKRKQNWKCPFIDRQFFHSNWIERHLSIHLFSVWKSIFKVFYPIYSFVFFPSNRTLNQTRIKKGLTIRLKLYCIRRRIRTSLWTIWIRNREISREFHERSLF